MSFDTTLVVPEVVRRKVAWHILPLIFALYVIAYLDRANVGFAKLRMQKDLDWLTNDVFGLGSGLFFFSGYLLLEIPGALLVEHWSARKWFARILITWGICSMAMAFVETAWQFYLARFLLGLAEAGFFPGVIVYFTHWFPRADRARAFSGFIFGIPVSIALGARVSGYIMDHDWFVLEGWQWVFLIEGAPAILFGVIVLFLLTDRPSQAKWLAPEERAWLEQTLARERQEVAASGSVSLSQVLRQPALWILALGILTTNTGGYALVFWLPSFMKTLLEASGQSPTESEVLNAVGYIYLCGLAGILVSGRSSDRTGERKWHCVAGMVFSGAFLAASVTPGQTLGMTMFWLCLMCFSAFFWSSPFWVLPTMSMTASAAAVSIGVINICANVGGLLGSPIVGRLKTFGFEDSACMLFLSCCLAGGGVIISFLRIPKGTHLKTPTG